jgi:glutamate racemase
VSRDAARSPDAPIGVLSTGDAGLAAVSALTRALPHEDVLLLADHAYAPYGRLRRRTVEDRAVRLAAGLVEQGAKAIVLASRALVSDALAAVAAATPVPVIALVDPLAVLAVRYPGERVGLVLGAECLRGPAAYAQARDARTGVIVAAPCSGLAALVERGPAAERRLAALAAVALAGLRAEDVRCVALGCIHAAAARAAFEGAAGGLPVEDGLAATVERVRVVLRGAGLLARRRRPGWLSTASSQPTEALTPRPPSRRVVVTTTATSYPLGQ